VRKVDHPCSSWTARCVDWLRHQGVVKRGLPAQGDGTSIELEDLQKLVEAMGDARAVELRGDLLRYMKTERGRKAAERCLALLARLPVKDGPAPAAPRVPFDTAAARRYQ
jgi:hypothetical protein